MMRLALALVWLLHWLPFPLLAACGRLLGRLFWRFGHHRRHVALTNLRLCFPAMDEAERAALTKRHFEFIGRSLLERGLFWWASPARIRRIVRVDGMERFAALKGQPVILLVPHFAGLDAAWTRLTMERDMSGIYASQNNPVFNAVLYKGRARFGDSIMLSRQDGTRRGVKAIRAGYPFFYLPDMDYGRRDAIFVPFCGVLAATITGMSRLARVTGATILPVVVRMTDTGYLVKIGLPWADYPGASIEEDTARMNLAIEAEVRKIPAQYYWLHRRFKTRPAGEKRPY